MTYSAFIASKSHDMHPTTHYSLEYYSTPTMLAMLPLILHTIMKQTITCINYKS